jgi:hypothetical protein
VFAATALTLNNENTLLPLVTVTVSVSAFPLSSEAKKDFTIAVVALGTVYNTVALVVVKSSFALRNLLAKKPTHCLGIIFRCLTLKRRCKK